MPATKEQILQIIADNKLNSVPMSTAYLRTAMIYINDTGNEALDNKAMDSLKLLPANVQETDQGADAIKTVLGNLRAILSKLAEIRNPFGSGQGKSASFQDLEERHAKLTTGSNIIFIVF